MRKLIAITTWLAIIGCGSLDDKKDKADTKEEAKTGDVEFQGYVQKAFAIKVNNKDFSDSEDFYTRFIPELIKPDYPDVAEDEVTIEGKYGLDEFGSGSKVYMSSVASEGHLYEGRTDVQSKFSVKVQAKALDETFKARIVIRIGLEVAKAGADGLHYCYLLYGTKDNILVSESGKPIIFDNFSTQLSKYNCADVNDDQLVIPGLGSETEGKADSTSVVVGSETKAKGFPSTGLLASYSDPADGSGYLMFAKVKDSETGEEYLPVVKVNPDGQVAPATEKLKVGLVNAPISFARMSSGSIVGCDDNDCSSFKAGEEPTQLYQSSNAKLLVQAGDRFAIHMSGVFHNFDASSGTVDTAGKIGDKVEPVSVASAATKDSSYLLRKKYDGTWVITKVNTNMVIQVEKAFSKVEYGPDALKEAKLWHSGKSLYLVTATSGEVSFKQLTVD